MRRGRAAWGDGQRAGMGVHPGSVTTWGFGALLLGFPFQDAPDGPRLRAAGALRAARAARVWLSRAGNGLPVLPSVRVGSPSPSVCAAGNCGGGRDVTES